MSGLTLRLKAPATERMTLADITPSKLSALSSHEIANLNVGIEKGGVSLGDAFEISGSAGDTPHHRRRDAGARFHRQRSGRRHDPRHRQCRQRTQLARCRAANSKFAATPATFWPRVRPVA